MEEQTQHGSITGKVSDQGGHHAPIRGAHVHVHPEKGYPKEGTGSKGPLFSARTGHDGEFEIHRVPPGNYIVEAAAFELPPQTVTVTVHADHATHASLQLPLNLTITLQQQGPSGIEAGARAVVGTPIILWADHNHKAKIAQFKWTGPINTILHPLDTPNRVEFTPKTPGKTPLSVLARGSDARGDGAEVITNDDIFVSDAPVQMIGGNVDVRLGRTASYRTADQSLWSLIRNRTRAISFTAYSEFIHRVLCQQIDVPKDARLQRESLELGHHVSGVGAYQLLKTATEAFLLLECGVCIRDLSFDNGRPFDIDEESARWGDPVEFDFVKTKLAEYLGQTHQLPYITSVIQNAFSGLHQGHIFCDRVLTARAKEPCLLELIWSYWHEEGMLAQTMNAVSRRFQNVRAPGGDRDPLAHLEIDPLRPLNNLLWGQIQDEQNRLTVKRRAYEYDHHYGLTLYGKALRSFRPADSRSKFLEGFHNLLHLCSIFFKEDNDTTVIADGYPLLNSLREVHLLLAQGAHNQFGDLPWTARVEMLIQQWLIARSEMRDFLQSRAMVPYKEAWMPQVDTMKTMQGWSDVTVTHFRDLGVYGEQLLLSIRYGNWIDVNDENAAKNWARYWRAEIQAYLHAYRAATGIDLTNPDTVDATMPAVLLQKRLAMQQRAR